MSEEEKKDTYIRILEERIYILESNRDDLELDYKIAQSTISRIHSFLNNHPHSTDGTLGAVHTMIDEAHRLINVTASEHKHTRQKDNERAKMVDEFVSKELREGRS